MKHCQICDGIVHHDGPQCFHCSSMNEAFGRLLAQNPKAAESWATAKQLEAALVVRTDREETDIENDSTDS